VEGAHDLPPRQRTLRTAIQHSYQLLDEAERTLLRRLGVFVGGFNLPAVAAVVAGSMATATHPLNATLHALIGKSLVRVETTLSGEQRFVMLETIREYALERLEASGEAEAVRRQHTDYYLALAEAAAPQLHGAEQRAWLDRLDAEHDNLRAALAWSQTVPSGAGVGLRLAGALSVFWFVHGHVSEGRKWLAVVLVREAGTLAARAKALIGAGYLAGFQEDNVAAHTHFEESLALFRKVGDKAGIAAALRGLGGRRGLRKA
jgi:predicted ATPase